MCFRFLPFPTFVSGGPVWGLLSIAPQILNMNTQIEELQDRAIIRIAAHLPDLIVYSDFSAQRPTVDYFDGVLMFVDISGKCQRDVCLICICNGPVWDCTW